LNSLLGLVFLVRLFLLIPFLLGVRLGILLSFDLLKLLLILTLKFVGVTRILRLGIKELLLIESKF